MSTVSIKSKKIKIEDQLSVPVGNIKKIIAWLLKNWSYCLVSTWFVDDAEQMRRKRWKMWERTNVAISQHACLNIGAPMYGPFSDDWIALQCMDGPSIGTLSIHRRSIYRNAIHHWRSIHRNAIHTSELRCMDPQMYGPSNGRRLGSFSGCRG